VQATPPAEPTNPAQDSNVRVSLRRVTPGQQRRLHPHTHCLRDGRKVVALRLGSGLWRTIPCELPQGNHPRKGADPAQQPAVEV
jgi:hypothetical protein